VCDYGTMLNVGDSGGAWCLVRDNAQYYSSRIVGRIIDNKQFNVRAEGGYCSDKVGCIPRITRVAANVGQVLAGLSSNKV
jgi:hypothetical protein